MRGSLLEEVHLSSGEKTTRVVTADEHRWLAPGLIHRTSAFGDSPALTDVDDAVRQANDSMYGLAAGIWTKDLSKAHHVASRLQAGSVWVNQYNGFDTAMPFGGYKQSGWGRELGSSAIELYTQTKAVNISL